MPRAGLNQEVIRAEAFRLIGERGYADLTMRALASRLGVRAASLYHHVPGREAVLRLIADHVATTVFGDVGLTGDGAEAPEGWRDLFTRLARRLRAALGEHPGVALIVATREVSPEVWRPVAPRLLASMGAALGVTDEAALFLIQSLYVLVTGLALAEFGDGPQPRAAPQEYYDAWFDTTLDTFLAGVASRYHHPTR